MQAPGRYRARRPLEAGSSPANRRLRACPQASANRRFPGGSADQIHAEAFTLAVVVGLLVVGAFFLLDRRLENVAERSAAIGGAVLRHGLLLLGDFQGLDRHRD